MSIPSKRSQEITNAFQTYVKGGKKSLIESISIQEIERALVEYALDKEFPFYIAMERIEQLKEIENRRLPEVRDSEDKKRNLRQRVADHLVVFASGIASGILLLLISQWIAS